MFKRQDFVQDRASIAEIVTERLNLEADRLKAQWHGGHRVRSCVIDDLLPEGIARALHGAFPTPDRMMMKRSFRENKHVAAQMDQYDPLLEDVIYAFQAPQVIDAVTRITGLAAMEGDPDLYAGGLSAMTRGAYLRPHLDNSHDGQRERYRVLNLLYYVTPGWTENYGGSLQL